MTRADLVDAIAAGADVPKNKADAALRAAIGAAVHRLNADDLGQCDGADLLRRRGTGVLARIGKVAKVEEALFALNEISRFPALHQPLRSQLEQKALHRKKERREEEERE